MKRCHEQCPCGAVSDKMTTWFTEDVVFNYDMTERHRAGMISDRAMLEPGGPEPLDSQSAEEISAAWNRARY